MPRRTAATSIRPRSTAEGRLLVTCGLLALLGCAAVILGNLVGILVVDDHDPVSETISRLAIGDFAWIQDLGLDLLALGVAAAALGLSEWRRGGAAWYAGLFLLILLAVDVVLIAEHNQYAGRPGRGPAIHIYLVYALYGIFALATFFLSFGLRDAGSAWRRGTLTVCAAWTLLAPFFFVVPTAWDGAYERLVGAIMVGWVAAIGVLLVRRGRRRAPAA